MSKLNRISPTALHVVSAVTVLSMFVVAYLLLVQPYIGSIDYDQFRSRQIGKLLASSDQVAHDFLASEERLRRIQDRIEATTALLPTAANDAEFMATVNKLADQTNLEIIDYRQDAVRSLGDLSRVDVSLKCVGSYASLCNFLHELHSVRRVTDFHNLRIRSIEGHSRYPIEFKLGLYFRAQPKAST